MKKIGIISFCYEAKEFNHGLHDTKKYRKERWNQIEDYADEFNEQRLEIFEEIGSYAEEQKVTHLLFPGTTLTYSDNYDWKTLEKDVARFGKVFKKFSVIGELKLLSSECDALCMPRDMGVITYSKGKEIGERIQQIFTKGTDNKILHQRLWTETAFWNHRVRELDGLRFLIWVCGEINFLKGEKSRDYRPRVRYQFGGAVRKWIDDLKFDVFFNPAHTPMGEAHLVKNKLKYLSRSGRIAIHTTNVPSFQKGTKSSIYCFENGKEVPYETKSAWREDSSWIMEIIDPKVEA